MKSKLKRMNLFDYVNYLVIALLCASFLYPVLLTVSISISEPQRALTQKIIFMPLGFTLDSYRFLLSDGRILGYYRNSILYAIAGTLVFLLFTSMMAYPFIISSFRGKKILNFYMIVTMFIGGGLIPYYFVVRALGLIDTIWVMIIPGAVSAYNVVIFRTFFGAIPGELRESAHMDGAGHYTTLFRIILPISKPLLATFALFSMVGKWNDFFTPLLFIRNDALMPVQMMLRRMLVLLDFRDTQNKDLLMIFSAISPRTIKSAAVIITIIPIMAVYPFLQKYFAKGVLVGSLKA